LLDWIARRVPEPCVVLDADPREQRQLLTSQTGNAALPAVLRQAGALGVTLARRDVRNSRISLSTLTVQQYAQLAISWEVLAIPYSACLPRAIAEWLYEMAWTTTFARRSSEFAVRSSSVSRMSPLARSRLAPLSTVHAPDVTTNQHLNRRPHAESTVK
jgi:hypothetical protein